MKRKFILAGLAAMVMLTGCGGAEEVGQTEGETVTESDVSVDTSAAAEEEGISEETETDSEEESEAVSETEETEDMPGGEVSSDGLFHGSGYTLEIDFEIWTDIMGLMGESVNLNTAEGFDGMFVRADNSGANMTFITLNVTLPEDITAENYSEMMEGQYSEAEGMELISCEDCTVGGKKCIKSLIENSAAGAKVKAVQYVFPRDSAAVTMTFTAGEEEWDELLPEFEGVVESLKFEK